MMTGVQRCQPTIDIAAQLKDCHADLLGQAYGSSIFLAAADEIERLLKAFEDHEQAWREREAIGNESGQALVDALKARIAKLEAELAISRKCNKHVECLCRGEVMDHAAAVARDGERK